MELRIEDCRPAGKGDFRTDNRASRRAVGDFLDGHAGDFACDLSSSSPCGGAKVKREGHGTDKPEECAIYDLLLAI